MPAPDSGLTAQTRAAVAELARAVAALRPLAAAGAVLRTYAAGDPGRPAVVLASACGMPAALCESWLRALATDHYAVTWETRGLFGGPAEDAGFDALGHGLDAQATDLLTVM